MQKRVKFLEAVKAGSLMNKTARNFLLDNMFSMTAYFISTGTVLASLTSYFNLPLTVSNLITGFSSTLPIMQLWGGYCYARTTNRTAFVRRWCLVWRCILPFVFFSVLLPQGVGAPMMIAAYFMAVVVLQFSSPAQADWMVGHVEGSVKADYYSIREMCFMLVFSAVFCVVSLTLDSCTASGTLQTAFIGIGFVLTALLAVSCFFLLRLPAPTLHANAQKSKISFLEPLKNKLFSRVLFTNILWSFAAMFIGGFAAMYQVRILNLSFYHIMLWSTIANLARAAATPMMARLAGRTSWRFVAIVCLSMLVGAGLLWMQVTPQNMIFLYPLASLLGCVPFAGLGVAFLKLQVETIPAEARSIYFSVNATLNGVASLVGASVCTALIGVIEAVSPAGMANANLKYIFLIGAGSVVLCILSAFRIRSTAR